MGRWLEATAYVAHRLLDRAGFPSTPAIDHRRTTALASAYDAATMTYRLRSLFAPNYGPNAALVSAGRMPLARVNALARNNVWAEELLSGFASHAVGTGVQSNSQYTPPIGNNGKPLLDDDAVEAKRQELNRLFMDWWDDADADGINSLGGLHWLIARGVRQGGDVYVRLRPRRLEDGLTVPLQLQVLSTEFCPYEKNEDLGNGRKIIMGQEYDALGKCVAFWFYREHPGEHAVSNDPDKLVRVPAKDVIHCFRRVMPGQVRGEWAIIRAVMLLNDVDEYEAAELWRKKGAAMFGGIIYAPDSTKAPGLFGESVEVDEQSTTDGQAIDVGSAQYRAGKQAIAQIDVTPGMFPVLPPGFDFKLMDPADVGPNFAAFMRWQMLKAAKAGGLTYAQLTGDMSGENYSASRVAQVDQRRNLEPWVWEVIIYQFCRPVWQAFCDAAVMSNAIQLPGYARNKRAAQRAAHYPQGWSWVDPLKEVQAAILAIRAGLKSPQMVINELGFNPIDVEREIVEWNKRADRDKRIATIDPRRVTQNGQAVGELSAKPPSEDPENGEVDPEAPPQRASGGGRRG